jgi:hypothetical protein
MPQEMMTDLSGNRVPVPQGATFGESEEMMTDLSGKRVPVPKGATFGQSEQAPDLDAAKQNIAKYPKQSTFSKADESITEALSPNPENYESALKTNAIEVPKTLGREVYSAGKTAIGMVPSMLRDVFSAPTEQEKSEGYNDLISRLGPLQAHRMVEPMVRGAGELVHNTPSYEETLGVLPEALGSSAGMAIAGKGAHELAPKVMGTVTKAVPKAVRMAAPVVERATTPAAIGTGLGATLGRATGLNPVETGAAGAGLSTLLSESPRETLFPKTIQKMRGFGLPKPAAALGEIPAATEKPTVPTPEALGETKEAPKTPQDKAIGTLKTAYDKANSDFQKAHEAREAYRASMDQNVEPPAGVQKAFDKAQKALDEAQFHYETALENSAPKEAVAEDKVPEVKAETKEPTPVAPENVKGPGQVSPETETPTTVRMRRDQSAAQEPQGPMMVRGGQRELPGGGVMGKPLQLPAVTERPVGQVDVLPPEKPVAVPKTEPVSTQLSKIEDLTREGLGGKELGANVPLREQLQTENLPPKEEKAAEEIEHPVPQVRANGENLANAIPKTPEGHALLQKLHDLSNVELRQLAINAGEDMGQKSIGRGKNSGSIPRSEVFDRMLKNHTPDELGKMVDEGKHLPSVSGGTQAVTSEIAGIKAEPTADKKSQGPLAPVEERVKARPGEMSKKYPVGKYERMRDPFSQSEDKIARMKR